MNKIPSFHFMGHKYAFIKYQILFFLLIFPVFFMHSSDIYKEKIYIHFDKSSYQAGEDIWFKIYLVDADTHRFNAQSKIVYVDLISSANKIIDSKIIKIEEGCGEGDFKLPIDSKQGQFTVRAYTNYMRNFDAAYFFRKRFSVSPTGLNNKDNEDFVDMSPVNVETRNVLTDLKPDIQFFPEGGYLVDNFVSRVGFKAVGIDGKGIDIEGIIVDETGKKVAIIKSSKFGLGYFNFIPISGKTYKAIINYLDDEIYYDLPLAQKIGVIMNVVAYQDNYRINLQSSLHDGTKNLTVIGSKNGDVICQATVLENKATTMINISKSDLQSGIVQFTVLDANGVPICERLVFVDEEENKVKVNIASSQEEYGIRDLVELEISLDQFEKKDTKANMSLAITDVTFVQNDGLGLDIKSHLLLNSELKGEIEKPGYYFYSNDSAREKNLDLLMMCQGWRQFIWNEVVNKSQQRIEYPIEEGFSFTGHIKKYSNHKKSESVKVSLIIYNKDEFSMDEIITNDEGYFEFGEFDFKDSTQILIQAKNSKTKKSISKKTLENPKTNYTIELDTFIMPDISTKPVFANDNYKNDKNQILEIPHADDDMDLSLNITKDRIRLDEIELFGKRMQKYDIDKGSQLYFRPSQRLDFAELGKITTQGLLRNLDGRISGLMTSYDIHGQLYAYFMRTGSSYIPLYLLDGMPVRLEVIRTIPMFNVLFVDVLRGTKAAVYGSAGVGGVIAVYTKDGSEINDSRNNERRGISTFVHPGYNKIRKFYEPIYKSKMLNQKEPDYRTTICWKPMLRLNKDGKAKISFYSADIATTYRVVLEGITENGEPITNESFISIE